jgi:polysaccharide chain length determinant protein (PEP-CTERM system associated)
MTPSIDISAYVKAFKRRFLLFVLPILLIAPLAAMIAYVLPPVYSATARVLVESQQIPSDLVQSTVSVGVEERIALIRQRLTTRETLLDIADKHDVYDNWPNLSPSEIVELMRANTEIVGVRLTGGRGGRVNGVNISFSADRPAVAAAVANEFLTRLLEQNVQARNTRAFQTSDYFRQEVERLSRALGDIELRLTEFRIQNESALPDTLDFRRNELASLSNRVFEREVRLGELEAEKRRIEEAVRSGEFVLAGATPEEREIQSLQQQLIRARSVYSESHPTIQFMLSRIRALQQSIGQTPLATAAQLPTPEEQAAEAVAAIDRQIEQIRVRREEEQRRIAELEDSIERTPSVQLALSGLQREYSGLQQQHRMSVEKLAVAETGERLEVNQQAERFEVIEQARVPGAPDAPNRPIIVAAGFAGSIGLGFGFVVLAELLNRSIRTRNDLERQLDLRPIVTIPYIATASERSRRRWTLRIVAALALIAAPLTLFYVDQNVIPLPLLLDRLISTLGVDRLADLIRARF